MDRISELAAAWQVEIARVHETPTSLIGFGALRDQPVVIKAVKAAGDEWHSGDVAAAFDGRGMVRVLATAPGAALMEQIVPGTSLVDVVNAGNDEQATLILADVMRRMMEATPSIEGHRTAQQWGDGFARYLASGNKAIAPELIEEAAQRYAQLCGTMSNVRLLHGDLQHYNVLHDEQRGWLAIDPKGVAGEAEMEVCAALRNPHGRADLITPGEVARRIRTFADTLQLDAKRIAEWAYVLGLLSAVWVIEDGEELKPHDPALLLVQAVRQLSAR